MGGPKRVALGVTSGSAIGMGLVALTGTPDAIVTWKKRFQDERKVKKQMKLLKAEREDKKQT